jgi:hypothetical protein
MSKEFNIDNYKYVETIISLSEWLQAYKPLPNEFNHEARFSGLLYEHEGQEWDHVVKQYNQNQWTLYRDEDGTLKIKNGLRVQGRIGYFLGKVMHNSHETIIVDGFNEGALEHRICGI